jgi:hypothetical protein
MPCCIRYTPEPCEPSVDPAGDQGEIRGLVDGLAAALNDIGRSNESFAHLSR